MKKLWKYFVKLFKAFSQITRGYISCFLELKFNPFLYAQKKIHN